MHNYLIITIEHWIQKKNINNVESELDLGFTYPKFAKC